MKLESLLKIIPFLCSLFRWFTKLVPKQGTILIVEDNSLDAEILQYRLKKLGWESEVASSGEVAQGLIKHSFYPIACIDMRLPGMPGQALMRLLSRDTPNTKQLIICGEPGDLTNLPDGMSITVIRKPASLEALANYLSSIKI